MRNKKVCRWYNETSGMKKAYDEDLLDKKWIEEYCWNEGEDCVRKKGSLLSLQNVIWPPDVSSKRDNPDLDSHRPF